MFMERKCKVIHYITTLNDGGAETLVKDYSLLLNKDHFNVKVVILWLSGDTANLSILRNNGVEIIVLLNKPRIINKILLKVASLSKRVNNYLYTKLIPCKLLSIIQKEKPNIIHCHLEVLQTIRPIADEFKHIRLYYTCHSKPENFLGSIRPAEAESAKALINYGLKFIALHQDMAKEINAMYGISNTLVIKNGIDLHKYQAINESKDEIRASIGINKKNAFVIGHIGRFSLVKNHTFLIRTFQYVKQRIPNAILLLIGAGELESKIKQMIRENKLDNDVVILSHRSDINRLLKAMDCFVFPSLYEGFGIALIEAQAVGLRCIVSDTINKSTFVSDKIIPMSLSLGCEEWAKEIISPLRKGHALYDIRTYDLKNEIKKLENIYLYENIN